MSRLGSFAACLLGIALATPTAAQLNAWQGPAVGSWDDAASWSLGTVPGPGHYVLLTPDAGAAVAGSASPAAVELLALHAPVSGTTTLTLDADLAITTKLLIGPAGVLDVNGAAIGAAETIVAGGLVLGDGALVDSDAGILNGGTIDVVPGASARIGGGALQNAGTLRSLFGGLQTTLQVDGDLLNGGTLQLGAVTLAVGGRFIHLGGGVSDDLFAVSITTSSLCANLGTLRVDFGAIVCGAFYNAGSFPSADGALVRAAQLTNDGTYTTGDYGSFEGFALNRGRLTGVVLGDVENQAGAEFAMVRVTGRVRSAGAVLVADVGRAQALELLPSARLVTDLDGELQISGDLLDSISDPARFELHGTLRFTDGSAPHVLRHPGADLGAVVGGYTSNFALPRLVLASGDALVLEDGNATPGVGVYVGALVLEGGVAQIASITANGANLYYDPANPENAYLGGLSYPLAGGGSLAPVP